MAKKKVRQELSDMLFKLTYIHDYIKTYGSDNDYDHDFVIKHLSDIKNIVEQDKILKESGHPSSSTFIDEKK